jgi:hypothetical protein
MADEQKPELTWEEQQRAEQDAVDRRRVNVELDEIDRRNAARRHKDITKMTDEELRRYVREQYDYNPSF